MKNFIQYIAVLLITGVLPLSAQESHQPLVATGKIPAEFTTASKAKYSRAIKETTKSKKPRKEVKARNRFALESNFILDDLLRSGRVLFNDEVSAYLGEVALTLTKSKPLALNESLRVYALRSSAVNAFATDRGEVFVTLGLLAQLENEAQLAYILAHELAHVEKKHSLNFYLKADKLDKKNGRSVLGRSASDEKLLAACAFSKEQENEADRIGLERMLGTRYRTGSLPVVFDVLKYSSLPFDDVAFDRNLLQSEHYRLPDAYWLEQVKPIEGESDDKDDKHHSHPNLKSRREAMQTVLAKHVDGADKSDHLVSAERFERVRDLARNELPLLYLHADRHPEAVYTASLLLNERPNDLGLKKCIAKALYLHAKFRNDDDYQFEGDYNDIEGQSQQVHHLFEKMPAKEATVLALHFAWKLHRENPDDEELKAVTEDLFFELARAHDKLVVFSNNAPTSADATAPVPDTVVVKPARSKYDRIRQQKTTETAPGGNRYWSHAFVGQLNDETFQKYWQAAEKRRDEWTKAEKHFDTSKGRKELKRKRKDGMNLGIPRIAIVNPFYLKLDERKDQAVQHIETEDGQEHFRSLIQEVSAISGLKTTLLDVGTLKENETETFNDIRFLNEWFAEQGRHFDLTLTPGTQQERINAIAKKYGTDYFLWTGVISLREKKGTDWLYIPASLVLFAPTLPLATYLAVKPKYEMLHYSMLYDVRTGRRQILKFETFNHRDTDAMVKAHLYDAFVQIKRK